MSEEQVKAAKAAAAEAAKEEDEEVEVEEISEDELEGVVGGGTGIGVGDKPYVGEKTPEVLKQANNW